MKDKPKLLTLLEEGKTLDELVEALNMRKPTIKAMIELLHHQGRVTEIETNPRCQSCPMSKSCPVPAAGREKLYVVTEDREDNSGDQ